MTQTKPPRAQDLAAQRLQEEALATAKSVQVPGQTKEQTKLIAKGIEKGIASYKQQQKAKARELDKVRKKAQKHRVAGMDMLNEPEPELEDIYRGSSPAKPALQVAGGVFALVALLQGLRYGLGWPVIINHYEISLPWSLAAVFVMAGMAFWMFRAARD